MSGDNSRFHRSRRLPRNRDRCRARSSARTPRRSCAGLRRRREVFDVSRGRRVARHRAGSDGWHVRAQERNVSVVMAHVRRPLRSTRRWARGSRRLWRSARDPQIPVSDPEDGSDATSCSVRRWHSPSRAPSGTRPCSREERQTAEVRPRRGGCRLLRRYWRRRRDLRGHAGRRGRIRDRRLERMDKAAGEATADAEEGHLVLDRVRAWGWTRWRARHQEGTSRCEVSAVRHVPRYRDRRRDRGDRVLRADVIGQQSCCHSAARPLGITTDYAERIGI